MSSSFFIQIYDQCVSVKTFATLPGLLWSPCKWIGIFRLSNSNTSSPKLDCCNSITSCLSSPVTLFLAPFSNLKWLKIAPSLTFCPACHWVSDLGKEVKNCQQSCRCFAKRSLIYVVHAVFCFMDAFKNTKENDPVTVIVWTLDSWNRELSLIVRCLDWNHHCMHIRHFHAK